MFGLSYRTDCMKTNCRQDRREALSSSRVRGIRCLSPCSALISAQSTIVSVLCLGLSTWRSFPVVWTFSSIHGRKLRAFPTTTIPNRLTLLSITSPLLHRWFLRRKFAIEHDLERLWERRIAGALLIEVYVEPKQERAIPSQSNRTKQT